MKQIEVVAAILKDENKVLATRRGYGDFIDMWEFPGGKIEEGETKEAALHREIMEELEVQISIDNFITTVEYDYPNFHLTMHCYLCTIINGKLHLNDHNDAKWISKDELDSLDWLQADLDVVEALKIIL